MAGLLSSFKRLLGAKKTPNNPVTTPVSKPAGKSASRAKVKDPGAVSYAYSAKQFHRLLLPGDQYEHPVTVPQKLVTDVIRNSLQNADEVAKLVPRLPSVVPKLLRSLRDPNASSKDFVDIIMKDPAMTAAVLKLANSVYFNPIAKRISDVEVAVVKLGIEGLRAVLSAAVMQPVLDKRAPFFIGFGPLVWNHSLHCAVLAEHFARKRKLEPFKAYLLGLVHDTGKITLFSELCRQLQKNANGDRPGISVFSPLISEHGLALSFQIAKGWKLPPELCLALKQQVNIAAGDEVSPYALVLAEANLVAEQYALWQAGEASDETCRLLRARFGLPEDIFNKLDNLSVQI